MLTKASDTYFSNATLEGYLKLLSFEKLTLVKLISSLQDYLNIDTLERLHQLCQQYADDLGINEMNPMRLSLLVQGIYIDILPQIMGRKQFNVMKYKTFVQLCHKQADKSVCWKSLLNGFYTSMFMTCAQVQNDQFYHVFIDDYLSLEPVLKPSKSDMNNVFMMYISYLISRQNQKMAKEYSDKQLKYLSQFKRPSEEYIDALKLRQAAIPQFTQRKEYEE